MEHPILRFETLSSSNDYLLTSYPSLPNGAVVLSKHQTAGRGRLGRSWQSEESSLTFSLLLKDKDSQRSPNILPLIAGASLLKAIDKYGLRAMLKWPNDIYLNDKKCAGILIEGAYKEKQEAIVIGVGVNISPSPSLKLLPNAISLEEVSPQKVDKDALLGDFLSSFDKYLEGEAYLPLIKERDYLYGKKVSLNYYGEGVDGTALGIKGDGSLLLATSEGKTISVISGEASLHQD